MSQRTEIQELISKYHRRLQKLREKEATFGINTPPETLIEIEDIEAKVERLQEELKDLESNLPPDTSSSVPEKFQSETIKQERNSLAQVLVAKIGFRGTLIAGLLGLVGIGITAYFGYLGIQMQIKIPIEATQTAEAKATLVANSDTPTVASTNTSTLEPTDTPALTATPSATSTPEPTQTPTITAVPILAEALLIPNNDEAGFVLDGNCDDHVNATVQTLNTPNNTGKIHILHDRANLYLCIEVPKGDYRNRFFAVYLSPDNHRSGFSQKDDYGLSVEITNRNRTSLIGTGEGNYTKDSSLDSHWQGLAYMFENHEAVEYIISFRELGLGLCGKPFRIAIFHKWVRGVGDDWGWPSSRFYDQPGSWQLAQLENVPCE